MTEISADQAHLEADVAAEDTAIEADRSELQAEIDALKAKIAADPSAPVSSIDFTSLDALVVKTQSEGASDAVAVSPSGTPQTPLPVPVIPASADSVTNTTEDAEADAVENVLPAAAAGDVVPGSAVPPQAGLQANPAPTPIEDAEGDPSRDVENVGNAPANDSATQAADSGLLDASTVAPVANTGTTETDTASPVTSDAGTGSLTVPGTTVDATTDDPTAPGAPDAGGDPEVSAPLQSALPSDTPIGDSVTGDAAE